MAMGHSIECSHEHELKSLEGVLIFPNSADLHALCGIPSRSSLFANYPLRGFQYIKSLMLLVPFHDEAASHDIISLVPVDN